MEKQDEPISTSIKVVPESLANWMKRVRDKQDRGREKRNLFKMRSRRTVGCGGHPSFRGRSIIDKESRKVLV